MPQAVGCIHGSLLPPTMVMSSKLIEIGVLVSFILAVVMSMPPP
jgi:hypothetical protein